jgi:tetratricopeptide (TPR) repeat protein
MSSLHLRGLAACALALLCSSAGAAAAQCSPWPGEPDPLPQLGGGDEMLERWASLRRDELRGLALLLEASDPVEARRLWLHAACLAPGDSEIAAALGRTALPVVHRIAVEDAPAAALGPRATLGAAFGVLEASARIPAISVPDPEREGFDFREIDAQIAAAAGHLQQARFRTAAELADLARARLARFSAALPVRERRARLELVAASARVALGDADEARNSLERALAADPELSLDAQSEPPKLLRLFEEARERARQAP